MKQLIGLLLISTGLWAQEIPAPTNLQLLGTRSWVRVNWQHHAGSETGYHIYWSTSRQKPAKPAATAAPGSTRFYITGVQPKTTYRVWVEAFNASSRSKALQGTVETATQWALDTAQVDIPSSAAVPEGMRIFWHDEFNDELLNRNKWFSTYYSNIDYLRKVNFDAMKADSLPEAAYRLTGHSIDLYTSDSLPVKPFFADGKKISSIQTYNWGTNENLLDNSRGGYYEVRVKRSYTGKPRGLNTAYWFDSPGPDLKYYLEEGTTLNGVTGIRPKGQVFEIDVFEYVNAQFVLHGHVDKNGKFLRNLNTHIAEGFKHENNWVVHGMLWTPNSVKHYINGQLIKAYTDKHRIYSPNHVMNVFLGSYGGGGTVNMEVDYIRGYQWPLEGTNELPNGGFELNTTLLPWEGTGTLSTGEQYRGKQALLLAPGQETEQYVYLDNDTPYRLAYRAKGGTLQATVENVKLVTGDLQKIAGHTGGGRRTFTESALHFRSGKEYGKDMKTVRISFKNTGTANVIVDDVSVSKIL